MSPTHGPRVCGVNIRTQAYGRDTYYPVNYAKNSVDDIDG